MYKTLIRYYRRSCALFCFLLVSQLVLHAQNSMVLLKSFDTIQPSAKTMFDVESAFQIIKHAPITLRTRKQKANNCENRAEFCYYTLQKLGFKPIQFWLFKEGIIEKKPQYSTADLVELSNGLAFDTHMRKPFRKDTYVYWAYHVATGVIIEHNGAMDTLIFDPWTQGQLTQLQHWAFSFFKEQNGRTAYVFPVLGQYKFYGRNSIGQLVPVKSYWPVDYDFNQMYCGLCGISPNEICDRAIYKLAIRQKRKTILKYLEKNGIVL